MTPDDLLGLGFSPSMTTIDIGTHTSSFFALEKDGLTAHIEADGRVVLNKSGKAKSIWCSKLDEVTECLALARTGGWPN